MMSRDAVAWLNRLRSAGLNGRQHLALVFLTGAECVANREYRRQNHVDALAAGRELRQMTELRFLEQHGATRGSYYCLGPATTTSAQEVTGPAETVLAYVREHGTVTNSDCRERLGLSKDQAWRLLAKMTEAGQLARLGDRRWTRYVLPS